MRTRDMTAGKPAKMILAFALPMMAGNLFQQLYTIVDAFFVGQYAGMNALAAVGAADWLSWMVFGIAWGYTQGFSVLISQRFGAGDEQGLKKAVGNSVALTAIICISISVVSLLLARPLLHLLQTPDEIMEDAAVYLYVLFAALPILGAYNVQAGILRAVGDAKTPLYAMVIASFTNISLDAVFVIWFRWGVLGAAVATVLAQGVSAVYCYMILRRIPQVRLTKDELRLQGDNVRQLIRLGTPTAMQNVVIGVGGTAVQSVVNGYGTVFVAGFTATNKLYGLMEMASVSLGGALSAYVGQNYGASKFRRIRDGVRIGAVITTAVSFVIAGLLFIFGRGVLSWFVNAPDPQLVNDCLDVAQKYLNAMLVGLFVLYLLHAYRCALQGMGDTVTPMVSGVVELFMRVGAVMVLPRFIGEWGVYFAELCAWFGAMVLQIAAYYIRVNKLPKTDFAEGGK